MVAVWIDEVLGEAPKESEEVTVDDGEAPKESEAVAVDDGEDPKEIGVLAFDDEAPAVLFVNEEEMFRVGTVLAD